MARNAEDIVHEYLEKGYTLDRIRAIAATKPQALRLEIMRLIKSHDTATAESLEQAIAPEEFSEQESAEEIGKENRAEEAAESPGERSERFEEPDAAEPIDASSKATTAEAAEEAAELEEAKATEETAEAAEPVGQPTVRARLSKPHGRRQEKPAPPVEGKAVEPVSAPVKAKAETSEPAAPGDNDEKHAEAAPAAEAQPITASPPETSRRRKSRKPRLASTVILTPDAQAPAAAAVEIAAATPDAETLPTERKPLQRQLDFNEQAIAKLQETIAAREQELLGLRGRFEEDCQELRRRAEQEVRLMRHHVTRLRRFVTVSCVAALALLVSTIALAVAGRGIGPANGVRPLPVAISEQPAPQQRAIQPTPNTPAAPTAPANPAITCAPESGKVDGNVSPLPMVAPQRQTPPARQAGEPAHSGGETSYTVRPNDSLWLICKEQLNDVRPETIAKVRRLNNISNDNTIRPGQVLKLPARTD